MLPAATNEKPLNKHRFYRSFYACSLYHPNVLPIQNHIAFLMILGLGPPGLWELLKFLSKPELWLNTASTLYYAEFLCVCLSMWLCVWEPWWKWSPQFSICQREIKKTLLFVFVPNLLYLAPCWSWPKRVNKSLREKKGKKSLSLEAKESRHWCL